MNDDAATLLVVEDDDAARTFLADNLTADGYSGYDFNEDKDGVWFEGTGQMAVAYARAGQPSKALAIRRELLRAEGEIAISAIRLGLTSSP